MTEDDNEGYIFMCYENKLKSNNQIKTAIGMKNHTRFNVNDVVCWCYIGDWELCINIEKATKSK